MQYRVPTNPHTYAQVASAVMAAEVIALRFGRAALLQAHEHDRANLLHAIEQATLGRLEPCRQIMAREARA